MLENYKKAFKAYDIRGAYGKNIDEHFSYIMGRAVWRQLSDESRVTSVEKKLLIGCDVRLQNSALISAFETWLKEVWFSNPANWDSSAGIFYANFDASVDYPYGVCSTPVLYYLGQDDYDLWVAFTASHNPPGDVGMKFFDKDVTLLSTEMLRTLFEAEYKVQSTEYKEKNWTNPPPSPPLSRRGDLLDSKVQKLYDMLDAKWSSLQKRHHFVVDFSTGASVSVEKKFFQDYLSKNHTIDLINDLPDWSFASHYSDTQEHENYEQLTHTLKEKGAEFGLMFDGDADRIGIVWLDWKVLWGDLLTAMIAKQILLESLARLPRDARNDSKPIVLYETMSSKMVNEVVTGLGGEARMVRVGRYFINQELKACGGVFAGESSGHYLFAELGGYEMPLLALYYICKEMEEYSNRTEFVGAYKKYFKSPVISSVVTDKEGALKKVQEKYPCQLAGRSDYDIKFVDGVSVYAPDFWFNLRPSNTEDKIKFTVEADTEEKMNEVAGELKSLL